MPYNSVVEINLSAIDHNLRTIRRVVGDRCGVCPIVKADAYGLGAVRVGRRLKAAGVDMLAVYSPEQAAELLGAAVGGPVLVLMPVRDVNRTDDLYRGLTAGIVHLTLHDAEHLQDLVAIAERYGLRINVHLAVDTGMNRGGCRLEDAGALLRRVANEPRIQVVGLYSHFAAAANDPTYTDEQADRLDDFLREHDDLVPGDAVVHLANTFGTFRRRRYHRTMVRLGLAWAGYGAELVDAGIVRAEMTDLRPSLRWSSHVIHCKSVPDGETVGYGRRWTADRDSIIGLVPVGYADGYPVVLAGDDGIAAAQVAVVVDTPDGELRMFAPVVGAINMDQITIDLTDVAAAAPELGVGTTVELVTPDVEAPNHLTHLAMFAGCLPHVLLCGIHPRVHRSYVEEAALVESFDASAATVR